MKSKTISLSAFIAAGFLSVNNASAQDIQPPVLPSAPQMQPIATPANSGGASQPSPYYEDEKYRADQKFDIYNDKNVRVGNVLNRPGSQPAPQPYIQPVAQPIVQPVPQPYVQPVVQPTVAPVAQPQGQAPISSVRITSNSPTQLTPVSPQEQEPQPTPADQLVPLPSDFSAPPQATEVRRPANNPGTVSTN